MPLAAVSAPERKRRDAYHHGNLRQALVDQAVRIIRTKGVDGLTLRDVGGQLRVSRTALYRHFADKEALLAAVATEGFRTFRLALAQAWEDAGRGRDGFLAQGRAYIRFALENPWHYRVMFGGHVAKDDCASELGIESAAAFRVLVDALIELQTAGLVRKGDPLALAVFVWASVHGTAMLAIGGQLMSHGAPMDGVATFAVERVWDALVPPSSSRA